MSGAKPFPWPFKAGPPEFQVALRPIPLAAWLLPDWEADWLPEKRELLRERRAAVVQRLAGSARAEAEAGRLIADALGEAGAPATLEEAAALISDDLVILEKADELWRVVALALCSPSFFSAEEAIGGSLQTLHHPVPDKLGPGGIQALGDRIGRVFDGLREDLILERFNWTVQAGPDRYTPSSAPIRARAAVAPLSAAAELMHLRVERQTIRRLPGGSVLFTIRVTVERLAEIFADPSAAAAFKIAWRGAPPHLRAYKRWDAYESLVGALIGP